MTTETLEGGCACGQIRYRLKASPLFVHCCHCRQCQRESGASFSLNGMIEADFVETTAGTPEAAITPTASGQGQTILRCPTCRVAVWGHYHAAGSAVAFVRIGTLDEPGRTPPDIHVFTESKQPWVRIPEGVPAMPAFYDRREHWPESSRQRLREMKARLAEGGH